MTDRLFKLKLLPAGSQDQFPSGMPLWEALLDMGVLLKTPCGGKGTCGKCKVSVSMDGKPPREVLACREAINDDISVYIEKKDPHKETFKTEDKFPLLQRIRELEEISFAVDIGTTTIKISLVDTGAKRVYRIASFLNPQRRYGQDVISRIAAAADPKAMARMSSLIREAVFISAKEVCELSGIPTSKVKRFILSGNTTMLCLFYGIDPTPIGYAPYRAPMLDFADIHAAEFGGKAFVHAEVSALPARAAYLGSDLVAGIAMCRERGLNKNTFFIDLGTNGELFLADNSGRILATSCAMGPALEGMNMSCGMTADDGAITHIKTSQDGLTYEMAGDGKPAGITGTAIIDIVSIMIGGGTISYTGAINPGDLPRPARYSERDGMREILLWEDIRLTQMDIRNLQLAKAASLAASRLLLQSSGIKEDEIKNVVLAGAIGEHLDIKSFRRLGFIPQFNNANWVFLGNTSLMAAEQASIGKGFTDMAKKLRDTTEEIVLTQDSSFQKVFIDSVNFPAREV
jgi:uncharacterized 2Fe-2S/4Fe-4S cluster protein (DUF4445 family)